MARLQGSTIKALGTHLSHPRDSNDFTSSEKKQGWLNACGVALGVLGAPLDAVAFFDCNYLI